MRMQSGTYDPFRPVRRIGIRAEIAVVDADAKANATASASGTLSPSDPAQTVDGNLQNPRTFATMERNAWVLDGNHPLMGADAADLGWWSEAVSGDDGTFAGECFIEYRFTADAKTIGLVMHFVPGYQPAVGGMRIRTYDADDAMLSDVTSTDGGAVQQIVFASTYRRMRIDFTKTALPGRRIRMTEIDFGITQRFDADSVADAEIRYKTDLASSALPFGQCRITIDNADRKYNLLNPSGIYQYLEEGQRVSVWFTVDGEDVYMGAFAFRAAEARDGALTAKITAVDAVAALDDMEYNGGRCAAASFADAIAEVLDNTGISFVFEGDIGAAPVMMCVPQNTTKREAVRMLTQAAMGCTYADRDGNLRFTRPEDIEVPLYSADDYLLFSADDYMLLAGEGALTANELYNYDGITVSEPVGRIRLVVRDDYSDAEIIYTAGDSGKQMTVRNPCIAAEAGADVAAWLLSRYARRKQYKIKNRCDPATELLDSIRIHDAYGQNDAATVTGITVHFNGGLYAETEAVG